MQVTGVGCLNVIGMSADPTDADDITISAMDAATLVIVETHIWRLKTDGTVSVSFSGPATTGNSYYIQVLHRNSLETWSKNPVPFTSIINYDFTTASTQAYDDGLNLPMKLVASNPERWAFFNGDINHDGGVDSQDMSPEEFDSSAGAFGYNLTDLNGDGASDALDMTIIENNGNLGVFTAHP